MENAAVGYGDAPILSRLSLSIAEDDRIGLLGSNGNGKSTFAKLLGGRLAPMAGRITRASKLEVGFFAQHQVDELELNGTPYSHVAEKMRGHPESKIRGRAALIGFSGARAETRIADLSGGEKARLLMGLATFDGPQLIILDEPTNHLDMDAREALVEALNDYAGAVVIVSPDRHLLELTADRLVLVGMGTATEFTGSLDDYRDLVLSEAEAAADTGAPKRATRKDARRLAAQGRERTQPLRDAIRKAEAAIARLTAERDAIDDALVTPAAGAVAELLRSRADLERRLAAAEASWLAAGEALERAEADV
jgi:ATP-binding cassette, subfamily F, member 3